mmetsp:Transcript_31928/g.83537  ORF Transcript_31928/g.83537 Transcript_31928/m.83537 type:complete len:288 (+) Transcript_31928:1148-2011(+)
MGGDGGKDAHRRADDGHVAEWQPPLGRRVGDHPQGSSSLREALGHVHRRRQSEQPRRGSDRLVLRPAVGAQRREAVVDWFGGRRRQGLRRVLPWLGGGLCGRDGGGLHRGIPRGVFRCVWRLKGSRAQQGGPRQLQLAQRCARHAAAACGPRPPHDGLGAREPRRRPRGVHPPAHLRRRARANAKVAPRRRRCYRRDRIVVHRVGGGLLVGDRAGGDCGPAIRGPRPPRQHRAQPVGAACLHPPQPRSTRHQGSDWPCPPHGAMGGQDVWKARAVLPTRARVRRPGR